MIDPSERDYAYQHTKTEEFSIHFIGRELFLSNQTLRSVQNEFDVRASRFDSLDDLTSAKAQASRVLVVDQVMLEDLLERPSKYAAQVPFGCLAFSYRKDAAARYLFERWDRSRYGEIGFLPMNVAPDVWRSILRLLMHEQLHLPSFLADCVAGPQATPCKSPASSVTPKPADTQQVELFDRLTKREKEVLRLVSQGQSNKVIAAGLGITEHTVKLHMHNVVGKIGVSNRTAAAHFYFEVAPFDAQSPRVG